MGALQIGTSGYSYEDWRGEVYPEQSSRKEFFDLYAQMFSFTELNFSYYRQPQVRTMTALCEKSPAQFRFSIKIHKSLSHDIGPNWKEEAKRFTDGIAPLSESGKLSGVLMQFPFSFHYTKENRVYLKKLCKEMEKNTLFIEFRNNEWQKESVYDEMKSMGLSLVMTDMPDLQGLPKTEERITSDKAYIRFHGRNSDNWWDGDSAGRYDYLYSTEEIAEWVPRIQAIREKTGLLIVAFNNHYKGKAVRNARELQHQLGLEG